MILITLITMSLSSFSQTNSISDLTKDSTNIIYPRITINELGDTVVENTIEQSKKVAKAFEDAEYYKEKSDTLESVVDAQSILLANKDSINDLLKEQLFLSEDIISVHENTIKLKTQEVRRTKIRTFATIGSMSIGVSTVLILLLVK